MYSASSNSTWISNTYTQEAGDTNWGSYKFTMNGGTSKLTIRTASTTSTTLSISNSNTVSSGDTLYLSTDSSTYASATVGSVTDGTSSSSFTSTYTATSPLGASFGSTTYTNAYFLKPDGTRLFKVEGQSIIEYVLSTANDIRTAVLSGKSFAHPYTDSGNKAFCFSADGKILYTATGAINVFAQYYLGTPWDLSTNLRNETFTISGLSVNAYWSFMRISTDGTKLIVASTGATTQNIVYTIPLTTPYDIRTAGTPAGTATRFISSSAGNYAQVIHISNDGKIFVVAEQASSASTNIKTFTASTAWTASTLSLTSTYTFNNTISINGIGGIVSNDGTSITICVGNGAAGSTTNYGFSGDVNIGQVINITSFSLSAAPVQAFTKAPTVKVSAELTANRISMYDNKMYFSTANTTSVTFGYNQSNAFVTGDTVLLNGANLVTLTNVTETLNGIAYANMSSSLTSTDSGSGVTMNTGITGGQVWAIRFGGQGSILFIGGTGSYGNGVYRYNLTTPYDISTGTLAPFPYAFLSIASVNSSASQTLTFISGIDFSANGKTMVVTLRGNIGAVYQYALTNPWDFTTATQTLTFTPTFIGGPSNIKGGRFNLTGTQFMYMENPGTAQYILYYTLSTPYDLSSRSANATSYTPGNNSTVPNYGPLIEPNGYGVPIYGYPGYPQAVNTIPLGVYNDISSPTTYPTATGAGFKILSYSPQAIEYADDGSRMIISDASSGVLREYLMHLTTLQRYVCTYATRTYNPTSVSIPDRSVAQTLNISYGYSNGAVFTGTTTSANARAISFKMTNNSADTTVNTAIISLWKS